MDQIQEGKTVIVKGSPGSAMCGHLLESIVGRRGVITGTHDGFYWVSIDDEKYLLTNEDLEVSHGS